MKITGKALAAEERRLRAIEWTEPRCEHDVPMTWSCSHCGRGAGTYQPQGLREFHELDRQLLEIRERLAKLDDRLDRIEKLLQREVQLLERAG